ncbi:MAG: GTPase Era [Mucilaginibacter polytrichastri]|nr:GTPase Era [Mucilaginibacter polytrichastri]
MAHKAGFVSIVGKPNAGKSTLLNALVGEKMAIVTPKAQTTRHRILGIVNDEDYQIVFSDTPGVIKPAYPLQEAMMSQVEGSLVDADIVLFVTDIMEPHDEQDVIEKLQKSDAIKAVLVNKIDLSNQENVSAKLDYWQDLLKPKAVFALSAQHKYNVDTIMKFILENLPEHPAYYDKEELSDRSERFFASEMIREKVFLYYRKEIPYSTEVVVNSFVEEEQLIRIAAEIVVERDSQKNILIGKNGLSIKKVGVEARQDMEKFFGKKIFLELFVKVVADWRKKENYLKKFGYEN